MSHKVGGNQRMLLFVARILALAMLAICPRALTAPALLFNRAQESKRPKPLKNIDRVTSTRTPNSERQGKEPRLPGFDLTLPGPTLTDAVFLPGLGIPEKAYTELTKPSYLGHQRGSPPPHLSSPPA